MWRRWAGARIWINSITAAAMLACLGTGIWQAHYWRDGVTLFGHSLAVSPSESSRVYQLYANALAEVGRAGEAGSAYERAWRANPYPNNHEAAEFLARFWLKAGRDQDVITLLEPLAREPDASSDVLGLLAEADARTRRIDEAMALYRRCTLRYPDEALAHFALADLLRNRGDVPDACAEYEAGLASQGDRTAVLAYLAWTYAHLDSSEAHERALLLARRAVDLAHGRDVAGLEALAAAEAAGGSWPEAVDAAQAALTLTENGGATPSLERACRERLASYRQGNLP